MKTIFKSIYRCLNQKLKIQLFILIIFSFIIPVLELIGLAAIIPVIQISLNEVSIAEYGMLYSFVGLFAVELDKSYFVYVLILLIFSFFLFKTFFLIFCENFRLKYIKSLQDIFSIKLYNTYIFSNYEDFSNFQFTEKNRNIGIVSSLTDYIKNCNQILVETLFFIFIFIFLLKYSFNISLIAFCIFFIVSAAIYLLSKTKLLQYSSI